MTVQGVTAAAGSALIRLYRVTMWSSLRSWRLYSCSRFTMTSNSDAGSMVMPVLCRAWKARVEFVLPFDLAPLRPELLVFGEGLELSQPLQVGQPPLVSQPGGDQAGQARVGQPEEAARADAVGLVQELLRPQLREVA